MASPPIKSRWLSPTQRTFVEVVEIKKEEVFYKNLIENDIIRSKSLDDFMKINEPLTLDTALYRGIPRMCSLPKKNESDL